MEKKVTQVFKSRQNRDRTGSLLVGRQRFTTALTIITLGLNCVRSLSDNSQIHLFRQSYSLLIYQTKEKKDFCLVFRITMVIRLYKLLSRVLRNIQINKLRVNRSDFFICGVVWNFNRYVLGSFMLSLSYFCSVVIVVRSQHFCARIIRRAGSDVSLVVSPNTCPTLLRKQIFIYSEKV